MTRDLAPLGLERREERRGRVEVPPAPHLGCVWHTQRLKEVRSFIPEEKLSPCGEGG